MDPKKDLNNDCWIRIFEFLNLKDQIAACRAHRRFHGPLCYIWQKKYIIFNLHVEGPETVWDLAIFLEKISATVKQMTLKDLGVRDWLVIQNFIYPNMEVLELLSPVILSDDQIFRMTKIFPNLERFYPRCRYISGKYIDEWPYLELLDLTDCRSFMFSYFEQILEKTQLRSVFLHKFCDSIRWTNDVAPKEFYRLQYIIGITDELESILDLTKLEDLKAIDVYRLKTDASARRMLEYVAQHRSHDLFEFRVDRAVPLEIFFINPFQNLKKIVLFLQRDPHLNSILNLVPNLRELIMIHCDSISYTDFYRLLNSIQMEFICVQYSNVGFIELILSVPDIVKDRTVPLKFNFEGNINTFGLTRIVQVKILGKSHLFQMTEEHFQVLPQRNFRFNFREGLNY